MWTKPFIQTPEFDHLFVTCKKQGLQLRAARSEDEAIEKDGDYWIICPFSRMQLFAADDLNEIARWLRIGVH